MALPQHTRNNFNTLLKASEAGHVALIECTDAKTGEPAYVIAMVNHVDGMYEFVPVARMIEGNPYEQLLPPSSDFEDSVT